MLANFEIENVVITTGPFAKQLEEYCISLGLPIHYTFIYNEKYKETNYIYSIYKARDYLFNEDIILLHGDIVFEYQVLDGVLKNPNSCMVVSSKEHLPEKDFKAVIENLQLL